MTFVSREEAGKKLGEHLLQQGVEADVVLGLPRGGVIVAAQVARALRCPLGAVLVRKIGHPFNREFAVGALTEHSQVLDERSLGNADPRDLDEIVAEERQRLAAYREKFHTNGLPEQVRGKRVLIVDDGLATGATTEAAVQEVRALAARQVIVAVPVASTSAVERLSRAADQVIALFRDPDFFAVGRYYLSFPQTTDEEVQQLLAPAAAGP